MDLITELNGAIEYIENHIEEEITIEKIAEVTSYSAYHFQRIFMYVAGISVSEYIRRRRLTLAAFGL